MAVREDRDVKGVGALIIDFFGVSIACLLRLLLRLGDEVVNLEGAIVRVALCFRPAATNGCRRADCGFILRSGSQTRHFDMKSTKSSSLDFKTCCNVFDPGRRLRPLELTTTRGVPFVSKKQFFARTFVDKLFVGNPEDLHNTGQLLLFVLARKNRKACI